MATAFPGFRHFHGTSGSGYAIEEHFEALRALLLTREGCVPVPGAGRGGLHRFHYPGGDAFLRVYRRGGAVRHLVSESYLLDNRALAEFRVHHAVQAAGLPVPPLLGAIWHRKGPIYRGAIATQALEGSDLLALCRSAAPPAPEVFIACGQLIRRMHDFGLIHADLNASNLFITPTGPFLLDLDRARILGQSLAPAIRRRNLERLRRSFQKHQIPAVHYAPLFDAYGD